MNFYGKKKIPFFFLIDFEMQKPEVWTLDEMKKSGICFDFNGIKNDFELLDFPSHPFSFQKYPIPYDRYLNSFQEVQKSLAMGESYLVNLTFKTLIETSLSLKEIFYRSRAKYKLFYPGRFLVFSPETFVRIEKETIFTYPMKGTIDASLPDAYQIIINDPKEKAEHVTIVDLLRNDLAKVSGNVSVVRFRYIEKIKTHEKEILQVSSEIKGTLRPGYHERIGSLIYDLLPAGSVSGAPKQKTLEIIRGTEEDERGFYTGIAGFFDGNNLESAVLIRFIEENNKKLFFRSGGGITLDSDPEKEYQELKDKVYVPIA